MIIINSSHYWSFLHQFLYSHSSPFSLSFLLYASSSSQVVVHHHSSHFFPLSSYHSPSSSHQWERSSPPSSLSSLWHWTSMRTLIHSFPFSLHSPSSLSSSLLSPSYLWLREREQQEEHRGPSMREEMGLRREEEEEGEGEWRMILPMLSMRRWNCVENESTSDDPAMISILMVHSSSLYYFFNPTVSPSPHLSLLLSIHWFPQMSCRWKSLWRRERIRLAPNT